MTTSSKRSKMLGAGIIVLIIGLLTGIGLWYSSVQREADAVRNLARAPSGCDTTLSFDAPGDYFVYIETAGQFDAEVDGDCGADGAYGILGGVLPAVSLSLTESGGDEVALDSRAGVSYDAAGFVGQSVRTFTLDAAGDFDLRVVAPGSPDVQFAAAVGRNPSDGVGVLQLGAVVAALAGLVLGGGLIIASRRSPDVVAVSGGPVWPTQTVGWPTSPPGMPMAPSPTAQAPVGPPTQYPVPSAVPPLAGTPPPPSPPATPSPTGSDWSDQTRPVRSHPDQNPSGPTWGSGSSDGSSGDGQQSPWAPPSDSTQ